MKDPLYITSHGILQRKGNTLYFVNEEGKKALPINRINEINCYGKVSLKSGASSLLMKEGIPVNFFNMYGYYEGSLYPRIQLNSGLVVVKQSNHYLDPEKGFHSREMVEGIKIMSSKPFAITIKKEKRLNYTYKRLKKK